MKNHGKRLKILLLAAGMVCALAAPDSRALEQNARRQVVTTFYPLYIMALNVAGGVPGIDVENLAPPFAGCLHDYALTTADMKKIAGAGLLIANGGGMESFLEETLRRFPDMKVVRLTDNIPLIEDGARKNPHVWVSISGAVQMVENLEKAMQQYDPEHAEIYRRNAAAYVRKLKDLQARMHEALDVYRGAGMVTFHEAFDYFAREFGFRIAAVIDREPGSEPNARDLVETIQQVRQSGIKVLFTEPQYPAGPAEAIARETGAEIYSLDPAVNGPDEPDAYLRIMESNLEILRKALQKQAPAGTREAR